MSLNKYMHPRNIYKTQPNFKQLAIDYPEFRSHVAQDISGKITIDFKDIKALKALTCTLLKKDFGLEVDMPLTKMIPTVPLRLNYILWIEDLLSITSQRENVVGIDIGTGASCIYSLLAAKKNGWSMVATDIDLDSLKYAGDNVERNSLAGLINVKCVKRDTLLKEAVGDDTAKVYDFTICNPPFFTSSQELNPFFKARRPDRPRPRNAFSASSNEVVTEGGEVKFLSKMIAESKELDKRVSIYTSMVGHKSSLPTLKKLLREADVMSFKQTEFCQGHTTRWALAWTFHDIDLRKVPEATVIAARKAKPKPIIHTVASCENDVKHVSQELNRLFVNLSMEVKVMKESKNLSCLCITAETNTWSHQRRKRREKERVNSNLIENNNDKLAVASSSKCSSPDLSNATMMVAQMKVHSPKSPLKRDMEDDDDGFYNDSKRIKLDPSYSCYLKSSVVVRKDNSDIVIELLFVEGEAGKEGLHQVLQYVKNNLKL